MSAHVPMSQAIFERFGRLAASMRAEFPACAGKWSAGCDPGVRFDLWLQGAPGSSDRSLQFTASYVCSTPVRFGWLENLAKRVDARAEGEHLVFEEGDGTKIFLSTRTGFVEKVEKHAPDGMTSFQLASLDTSPDLDRSAFDLPRPASEPIEGTAFFAERMQQVQTQSHRGQVFEAVASLVEEKKIGWNPEARAHLARVLGALHADGWTRENEIWIGEMRRRMKEFAAWLRERLADPALADPDSRTALEQSVGDWRRGLALSAESALDRRLSEMTIEPGVSADESLCAAFAEVEREAVKATLQSAIVEPLLREFDEAIERARRGE